MNILIHPTYFPNIAHFVAIVKAEKLTFEYDDNFLKQTYRNRTYIYAANGKLLLNIPVIHTQKNRQKYKDVKISQINVNRYSFINNKFPVETILQYDGDQPVSLRYTIEKNGKIIFLSRLYEEKEFNNMIEVIENELQKS
mgnify:CR=1 FL=1